MRVEADLYGGHPCMAKAVEALNTIKPNRLSMRIKASPSP
jgi:hypothetical protein